MSYDPTSEGERAKRAVVGLGEAIVVSGDGVGVACTLFKNHKNTQEKYFGYYILYIFEIRYACQNR